MSPVPRTLLPPISVLLPLVVLPLLVLHPAPPALWMPWLPLPLLLALPVPASQLPWAAKMAKHRRRLGHPPLPLRLAQTASPSSCLALLTSTSPVLHPTPPAPWLALQLLLALLVPASEQPWGAQLVAHRQRPHPVLVSKA